MPPSPPAPAPSAPATYILGVTGMVGAGKSTLAQALATHLGGTFVPEPVGSDNPWLEAYYRDTERPSRYALPLQMHFAHEEIAALQQAAQTGGVYVFDQVLPVTRHVWVEKYHDDGMLSDADYIHFDQAMAQVAATTAVPHPDLTIFLHGPLSQHLDRIRERQRSGEDVVDPVYWADVHRRFGNFLSWYTEAPTLCVETQSYDVARSGDVARIAEAALTRCPPPALLLPTMYRNRGSRSRT